MTVLLDTAVLMYAAGRDHPMREPARDLLRAARAGNLDAVISAEVVQEVLHRFAGGDRHEDGVRLADTATRTFGPVLSIDHGVMRRTIDLARRHPTAKARDLVHVATCQAYELEAIVSPDVDFDRIGEVRRIAMAPRPMQSRG